jgi:hypothetical protein
VPWLTRRCKLILLLSSPSATTCTFTWPVGVVVTLAIASLVILRLGAAAGREGANKGENDDGKRCT